MCGRFTLTTQAAEVARLFEVDYLETEVLAPRYNVAPTQEIPAVRYDEHRGGRSLELFRWGLLPYWVGNPADWPTLINARSETAHMKPAFQDSFADRRCIVVADGFYEWKRAGGRKQPFFLRRPDGTPFGFAGLWEYWEQAGERIRSCTILTTAANDLVAPLHDRMPVILPADAYGLWLDPAIRERKEVEHLLRPVSNDELVAIPVSDHVNRTDNDDIRCIEAITP